MCRTHCGSESRVDHRVLTHWPLSNFMCPSFSPRRTKVTHGPHGGKYEGRNARTWLPLVAHGSQHPVLLGEGLFVVAKWERVEYHVMSIALGIC